MKAKGRQRFRLVSARRQTDGNLVGQVTLLPEIDLGDPLDGVRLRSQDRYRSRNPSSVAKEELDDAVKGEDAKAGDGCFGRLRTAMRRGEDSNLNPVTNPSSSIGVRRRKSHCQGMTRLSYFYFCLLQSRLALFDSGL